MVKDREKRISERAYAIWEQEGRPEGRETEHWREAERQVLDADEPEPAASAAAPSKPRRTATRRKAETAG